MTVSCESVIFCRSKISSRFSVLYRYQGLPGKEKTAFSTPGVSLQQAWQTTYSLAIGPIMLDLPYMQICLHKSPSFHNREKYCLHAHAYRKRPSQLPYRRFGQEAANEKGIRFHSCRILRDSPRDSDYC
jgi:hypothetical protein